MKAAPKTPKAKRQEEQANFIGWRFALLCAFHSAGMTFLLVSVAQLPGGQPRHAGARQGDMRSLRVRSTARGMITVAPGGRWRQRTGEGYLGRSESPMMLAGHPGYALKRRWRMPSICRAGSAGNAHQYQSADAFYLSGASGKP